MKILRELIASLKRIKEADPVTFWISLYSAFVGSLTLILKIARLYL